MSDSFNKNRANVDLIDIGQGYIFTSSHSSKQPKIYALNLSNVESRLKDWQVRRSFVEELELNASEVEIVLDYFVYGRQVFQPDELAFVEGSKP